MVGVVMRRSPGRRAAGRRVRRPVRGRLCGFCVKAPLKVKVPRVPLGVNALLMMKRTSAPALNGVAAVDDGDAVGDLGHLRQLEIRQRSAFADALVSGDGDGGQSADIGKEGHALETVLLDDAVGHLRQARRAEAVEAQAEIVDHVRRESVGLAQGRAMSRGGAAARCWSGRRRARAAVRA